MPRETVVHGDLHKIVHESEAGEYPDGRISGSVEHVQDPDLNVNWNREGEWVQVALTVDHGYLTHLATTSEDGRVQIPTNVLSRKELNHLIRTLRRARDGAYGSDE